MVGLSRSTLVSWVNEVLELSIAKVDDFGNGAVYCQMLDTIFGDIPMHRVIFDSKNQLDMETNYKILQNCFSKRGITRKIEARNLMKCKLQDNLDFSNWLYNFWESQAKIVDYDPVARREASPNPSRRAGSSAGSSTNGDISRRVSSINLRDAKPRRVSSAGSTSVISSPIPKDGPMTPAMAPRVRRSSSRVGSTSLTQIQAENQSLKKALEELQLENRTRKEEFEEMHYSMDVLLDERKLYYDKLVEIENLMTSILEEKYEEAEKMNLSKLPDDPTVDIVRSIQKILFASPEGFSPVNNPADEPF